MLYRFKNIQHMMNGGFCRRRAKCYHHLLVKKLTLSTGNGSCSEIDKNVLKGLRSRFTSWA